MIFILIGVYSLYNGLGFTEDSIVKGSVFAALLFNATFYHYVAGYTEMDAGVRAKLATTGRVEWVIRVINQCVLLSLWFWLDHGWRQFGTALFVLYGSFLLWDLVTWRCWSDGQKSFWQNLRGHKLFWIDVVGAVLSVLYVKAGYVVLGQVTVAGEAKNNMYFLIGGLSLAYLVLPLVGMRIVKFNPFQTQYRSRAGLH